MKYVLGAILSAAVVGAGATMGGIWSWNSRSKELALYGLVEIQEIRLASKIGGRVGEVLVEEGATVQPDQVLVRIETPELSAQRDHAAARIKSAEAELLRAKNGPRKEDIAAARAALAAAEARWQRLKAGWRIEELRQAEGDLRSAEANFALAEKELERIESLYKMKSIARSDYDRALADRNRTQGAVTAAKARFDMLTSGSRKEDLAEAAAEIARLKANLDLLLAGTRPEDIAVAEAAVSQAKAQLAEIQANLAEAEIHAPERAVIEVLSVRKGDVVAPNQPVVRVLRTSDLWVRAYVPETELGKIVLGQPAHVEVDSYPDKRLEGTVIQINAIAEFTPRNVQSLDQRHSQVFGIKVRVPDSGILKSGMAARVYLPVREAH